MSGWHREHPELAGTEADPWMANAGHAAAAREVTAMRCPATMEAVMELEEEGDTGCTICGAPAFSHRPEVVNDVVESEARHDWLDERDGLERGDDGP